MALQMESTTPSPPSICEACLSVDRKLSLLVKDEYQRFFDDIIDPLDDVTLPLLLCFECIALTNKFVKFKRQIRCAHGLLAKYKHEHLQLGPNLQECPMERTEPHRIDRKKEYVNNNKISEQSEELGHVKEEIDESNDDGGLLSEEIASIGEELLSDGQKLKPQKMKNEDSRVSSKKIKTKKKRKMKNRLIASTEGNEFSESDDEPLKVKKKNAREDGEEKSRVRKKMKDDSGVKKRKARREKPPGVVYNGRVERQLQKLNVGEGRLEMVLLSWQQVQEERDRILKSENFQNRKYKCYDCVVAFNHRVKLDEHMKKHDMSAGEVFCDVCKVRCRNNKSLSAHRTRHRVRWRCVVCGRCSSRAAVSADHLTRRHPRAAPAPAHTHCCAVCAHTAPTLGKLRAHMRSHAETLECELCGKTFRGKSALRTHLFIHKGEKEFACPKCNKKFLFKKAMQVHMVTHNESEQLYCHECDVNFKNHMSYYHHMKYSLRHIDPAKLKYSCNVCEKKFAKASRLEEHNMAVHLKITPIECAVEGCNFTKKSLERHLLRHKSEKNMTPLQRQSGKIGT